MPAYKSSNVSLYIYISYIFTVIICYIGWTQNHNILLLLYIICIAALHAVVYIDQYTVKE